MSNQFDFDINQYTETLQLETKRRSDRLMNYFLWSFFLGGLLLAFYFDTWFVAFFSGGLSLLAYYSTKILLPYSNLYQYVLSVVLAIFMAQYIYQMHGLFEMHFFAFIGSAVLITYQNWKLQVPMLITVVFHHATLAYLHNSGVENVYFTQVSFFDLQTFSIHIILTAVIFFTCGLWSYQLKKYNELHIQQTVELGRLQKNETLLEEKRKTEDALRIAFQNAERARMEAEQANRAKSIFLATMSHEIRTPMNGVIGMSALLAETPLTDQQRMYTQTIASCGESLLNVINDILDFSKIESGNMELDEEDFNLRSCLEDILDIFGKKAAETGIDLIYHIDSNVPLQIVGDELRLKQVVTNLISNALKFTKTGEVFVGVHLLNKDADDNVELEFEVRDTGIGIPVQKMDRLFKAFSQVDSSTTRKYGGTGLGLAICEKLVKLMRGKISARSKEGQGSTFFFSIKTKIGTKPLVQYTHYSMLEQEGKRVLVVDDNFTNRVILKTQLEQWKLEVVLAPSGKEALRQLNGHQPFDLIITDMQMPDMDGVQFTQQLKERHKHIAVILLSSIGDEFCKDCGHLFSAVLTKPVKQHLLNKQILAALKPSTGENNANRTVQEKMNTNFAVSFPLNILIAEDNLINQQVILHILSRLGYSCTITSNGNEALDALSQTAYDLVLMDMQMPEMDGVETTEIIRSSFDKQPIIIALTANTLHDDQQKCLQAGMNDYLSKPIKLEELTGMLEKWHCQIKSAAHKKTA